MAASLIRGGSGTRLRPLVFKWACKANRLKLKPSTVWHRNNGPLHFSVVCQISSCRHYSLCAVLNAESKNTTLKESSHLTSPTVTHPNIRQDGLNGREHYIPITRQSLTRYLVEAKDFLTEDERKLFPHFVRALDIVLVNKYLGVLEDLKVLFDPCNPDKETLKSRELTRKEKLDSEFSLLELLENVLTKANFWELSPKKVEKYLKDHEAAERVRLSVDTSRYDVLRFWVLGHEVAKSRHSLLARVLSRLSLRSPKKPEGYYKRVVVALRLKKDSKLTLKAYKEVPVEGLEMLLPDGNIHLPVIDKAALVTTAAVASSGLAAKLAESLVSVGINLDWALLLSLVSGALGLGIWSKYTDRRNAYLANVSRILYFKTIASNQSLLTLLVDRAEDESLKEAVLAYAFLLNSQPQDLRNKIRTLFVTLPPGGLPGEELETTVEKWLLKKTGAKIKFNSAVAVKTLKDLGFLSEKDSKFHVLQLDAVVRLLPQAPQSVLARQAKEAGLMEGYDRDEFLETDDKYREEDHKMRRYGWF